MARSHDLATLLCTRFSSHRVPHVCRCLNYNLRENYNTMKSDICFISLTQHKHPALILHQENATAYTCFKPTAHSGLMKTLAVEDGILQDVGIAFVDWQMKYKHHVRKLVPHKKPGKCGSEPERAQEWVSESIHYRSPEVQIKGTLDLGTCGQDWR